MRPKIPALMFLIVGFLFFACGGEKQEQEKEIANGKSPEMQTERDLNAQAAADPAEVNRPAPTVASEPVDKPKDITPKITFVELGSVNCIPCKAMQPVMESIEHKYGDQIRVVFYDVWTPKEQKYAKKFGIRIIPTQVFLDAQGNEIMRHEGFFAEAEIDRFLQAQGLKVLQGS